MSEKNKSNADSALWHDPLSRYLSEFHEHLRQLGLSNNTIARLTCDARHFLIWLRHLNFSVKLIDDAILLQFRDHQCQCHRFHVSWQPDRNPRTRKLMAGVLRLVSFLEKNGHVSHPGELDQADCLLERFDDHLRDRGYRMPNIARSASRHLMAWLHRRRIPLAKLDAFAMNKYASMYLPKNLLARKKVFPITYLFNINKYLI